MTELLEQDFGEPLHSFIICGEIIHELEVAYLKQFMLPNTTAQWKCE